MGKYKKEELENLILRDKLSYEEIGRQFNVTGAAIKKAAQRLGIELPQRRKINNSETFNRGTAKIGNCINCNKEFILYQSSTGHFCSNKCFNENKSKKSYIYFLQNPQEFNRANYSPKAFKKYFLEEQDNKCAICNCDPIHNKKKLVFICDHIDGNASNNERQNLRLVCPNCDSQLDTYKSKNKNGSRSYYRYNKEHGGIQGSNMHQ